MIIITGRIRGVGQLINSKFGFNNIQYVTLAPLGK
jgi:hypothetical protein